MCLSQGELRLLTVCARPRVCVCVCVPACVCVCVCTRVRIFMRPQRGSSPQVSCAWVLLNISRRFPRYDFHVFHKALIRTHTSVYCLSRDRWRVSALPSPTQIITNAGVLSTPRYIQAACLQRVPAGSPTSTDHERPEVFLHCFGRSRVNSRSPNETQRTVYGRSRARRGSNGAAGPIARAGFACSHVFPVTLFD